MNECETILIVDDTKENLDILLDILEDFDVIAANSGAKAIEIAKHEKISLILLDIVMPDLDGYQVCEILKAQPLTKEIPIIFVTAKTDEESIAQSYSVGANDYVSKPLKRVEVIARVKTQLTLQKTIKKLEFLASRDSMTGLYNRRKFFEMAMPRFNATITHLFISMIDIDHFKKINDTYGHDVGDRIIKLITQVIYSFLPEEAIFARIGGEEFVVLCESEDKESLVHLFENIQKAVQTTPLLHDGRLITCTISNGIAQKNAQSKTLDCLMKQADLALYEAKNNGRNKIIFRC